jgi:SAM-dependent methyltransferase
MSQHGTTLPKHEFSGDRALCPVCNDTRQGATYVAGERIFGMLGRFNYVECMGCGSLYLRTVPDLRPYYPERYHGFIDDHAGYPRRVAAEFRRRRLYLAWSRLVGELQPTLSLNASILDVGSGAGELLTALTRHGYRNVLGLDPFLERDIARSKVRILKQTIESASGSWDLIMFNHSLEHVVEPRRTIEAAISLLRSPESLLLIRIPVINDAWRRYGIDWVQLDAPRHTFIPTEMGLRGMVEGFGASVERVVYDSSPFQFWASERYRAGRKLEDLWRSRLATLAQEIAGELRYGNRVREMNREGRGDQAAFFVRRR